MFYKQKLSYLYPILFTVLGVLLILLSIFCYDAIISIVFATIGIFIIGTNILPLIVLIAEYNNTKRNELIPSIIFSILAIIFGVIFIINHNNIIITIMLSIILLVAPIYRLIVNNNIKEDIKKELPLIIVGIVILFNFDDFLFKIILITFGALVTIHGILNLIFTYRINKANDNYDDFNNQNNNSKRIDNDNIIDC